MKITDDDYRRIFHGTYPLDPTVLQSLLEAVAAGHPSVIGVDIATDEPQYRSIATRFGNARVVWAANVAPCSTHDGGCPADDLVLTPVLGGQGGAEFGFAHLSPDGDGLFRRFRRLVVTRNGIVRSFAYALLHDEEHADAKREAHRSFLIPYGTSTASAAWMSAAEVLRLRDSPAFARHGPLTDRVVLVGGDYARSDLHPTPRGNLPGVEIWARIVEAEMSSNLLAIPSAGWVAAIAFLAGMCFLFLFHRRSFTHALILSVALMPVLAVGCSYLLSGGPRLWPYFLPMLLLVLLTELFERTKEIRNARVEKLIEG